MTILLVATGTRGDIQPYLALGRGLQQAGYPVLLAAPAVFQPWITRQGLPCAPLNGNPSEWLTRDGGQAALTYDGNLLRNMQATGRYWRAIQPLYRELLDGVWELARPLRPRMIVYGLSALWAAHLAEALAIPAVGAFLQPFTPTRAFPSALLPTRWSLGAAYNRLTHRLVEQAVWLPWQGLLNQWRIHRLGLRAATRPPQPARQIYGFSPAVVPRPPDWPVTHSIVGYWFLDEADETLPDDLQRFIEKPAVFVGLGSPGARDLDATLEQLTQALRIAGLRAVLAVPGHLLDRQRWPEHVFPIAAVPHTRLFPRLQAAVHHGGAGTTAAALQAGIPNLILPLAIDQFFWGERIAALGLGPSALPQRALTPIRLQHALTTLVTDSALARQARQFGQQIRAEAGIAEASRLLQALL